MDNDLDSIAVVGLGYVGLVTSLCLCELGYKVIGVDSNADKIEALRLGKLPVKEKDLEELYLKHTASGAYSVDADIRSIVDIKIVLICVGTPPTENGEVDLGALREVSKDVGLCLKETEIFQVVVVRSTVPPKIVDSELGPILESVSGKKRGKNFGLCINPEFLRESTAVQDFFSPSRTVIGGDDPRSIEVVKSIYEKIPTKIIITDMRTASFIKYMDNSWHALKIVFANEVHAISSQYDVDTNDLFSIFTSDFKMNISDHYLRPGFSFGGSCLPKDVRAINVLAEACDVDVPMLRSIIDSNDEHLQRALDLITSRECERVGILGLSFKEGTDDLRSSPFIRLIKRLHEEFDKEIRVFDALVSTDQLDIALRNELGMEYGNAGTPFIWEDSRKRVIDESDIVILSHSSTEDLKAVSQVSDKVKVIDLSSRGPMTFI